MLTCVIKLTALHKLCVWVWKTAKLSHQYHIFICTYAISLLTYAVCSQRIVRQLSGICTWNVILSLQMRKCICTMLLAYLRRQFLFTDPEVFIFTWYVIPAVFEIKKIYFDAVFIFSFKTIGFIRSPVTEKQTNKTENLIQDACSSL